MIIVALLIAGLEGCAPCPTLGPPPDREGWQDLADEVAGSLEEDGVCPTEPPAEVVMSWGCPYTPRVDLFEEASTFILATARRSVNSVFLWIEMTESEVEADCDTGVLDEVLASANDGPDAASFYFTDAQTDLPHFFGPDVAEAQFTSSGVERGLSYSWVCLEAAPGPEGAAYFGPASWRGSVFLHSDDVDGQPLDVFGAFDGIACAFGGENEGAGSDYYGTWDESCDGIDNDYDGEIDEGAEDADGDGVSDCAE